MQGLLIAGRYRLAGSIGSGGMGRVWRAHDEVLHRAVAIKELTAALYVSDSDQAVLLARTRAEARAAARINHSAVVTVHDVLEHDGRPWIVMELVEGNSLADAVKERGRVEAREAARIGLWVLRALHAAHSAGVLHRDVKPGNVLLGRDGRVLLTDFGIAQIDGDTTITRTGEVVGSVDYLAPERVRGHDPGPASDLWALGATLYTAVEGRSPFRRTSPLSTIQAVVEEEAAEPRHAGPLGPVIAALLCKEPAGRPSAEEAEQMLAEAAAGRRPAAAPAFVPAQGSGVHTAGARGTGTAGHGTGPAASWYGPGAAAYVYGGGYGPGTTVSGYGSGMAASGHGPATPVPGPGAGSAVPGRGAGSAVPGRGAGSAVPGHTAGSAAPGHGGPSAAAADRSATGPSAVGPTVVGRPPERGAGRAGLPRGRLRTLALVVAVAAVVGSGAAVAFQEWKGVQDDTAGTTSGGSTTPAPSPSVSASGSPGPKGTVPASWKAYHDPWGFTVYLPDGWSRKVVGTTSDLKQVDPDLRQVDYTPDGGRHFVRIAIDTSPDFMDAHLHQADLDEGLAKRLVDYHRVRLVKNIYRDFSGSLWECTWTAQPKDTAFPGPRHATEETYTSREGIEYAIYISSPAADWAETSKQFKTVLQGWQEPAPGRGTVSVPADDR